MFRPNGHYGRMRALSERLLIYVFARVVQIKTSRLPYRHEKREMVAHLPEFQLATRYGPPARYSAASASGVTDTVVRPPRV